MATKRKFKDFLDFDYLEKLSEEELDWLEEFADSYYHGNKPKNEQIEHKHPATHYYKMNNQRIRDVYAKMARLSYEAISEPSYEMDELIIELIDSGFSVDEAEDIIRLWMEKHR